MGGVRASVGGKKDLLSCVFSKSVPFCKSHHFQHFTKFLFTTYLPSKKGYIHISKNMKKTNVFFGIFFFLASFVTFPPED